MLLHFFLWKNLDVTVERSGADATRFVLLSVCCVRLCACGTCAQDGGEHVYLGAVDKIPDTAHATWGSVFAL